MTTYNSRRHHTICSCPDELGLSLLFRRACDDMKIGVQIASSQDYINIISIIWKAGRKSACVFHTSLLQRFFKRGVTDQHRYSQVRQFGNLLRISFDHNEGVAVAENAANQMR